MKIKRLSVKGKFSRNGILILNSQNNLAITNFTTFHYLLTFNMIKR